MSTPVPTPSASFLRRKIAGIPALYLLGGLAVVLAVYAWRSKATKVTTAGDTPSNASTAVTADAATPYAGLDTTGTVYASTGQTPSPSSGTTNANSAISTNQEWLNKSVAYLLTKYPGASAGDLQTALQLYLNGNQLSMTQGQYRDAAIAQYGLPPETPAPTTTAANVAVQNQSDPRRAQIVADYEQILGREPSLSELNYWDGSGRNLADIRALITQSQEASAAK